MEQSILLIGDNSDIMDFMEIALGQERYRLTIASTGMEALTTFQTTSFDLVLLDLGLPDIDGIDLLKILRKRVHLSIVIISIKNNEEEKVRTLDLGADGYVAKPFGASELLARICTALRCQDVQAESLTVVENKNLKTDFEKQLAYRKGQEIRLTENEHRILTLMSRQLEKVVACQTLMAKVWGPYSDDSQTLRVNISNIRRKIEDNALKPEYLITEVRVGYRLRDHRLE